MPSYDYKCSKCNEIFTITKSMNDDSTPKCPCCGAEDVNKVWGGIQFKGCGTSSGGSCGSCSGGSCGSCH